MAIGDEIYERERRIDLSKEVEKKVLKKLLEKIEGKNSWGKNELKSMILDIIVQEI